MSGRIVKVSGPLVVAEGMEDANMADVVRVGQQQLIGEILNMTGGSASIQVYEETSGLGPGAEVITTGMPLTLRVGIKPTPSIGRPQKTISLARMENTELTIRGRHDPCIAHRAVPVVEAVTACVLLDLLLEEHHGTF